MLGPTMETVLFLQQFASPGLDRLFTLITDLGSAPAYIAMLVIVYLGFGSPIGGPLGTLLLVGFFVNFHLKGVFDTPRPFEIDAALARSDEAGSNIGAGFPSGHTQTSLLFWGYLAAQLRRPWAYAVAAVIVALVASSRMYLGLHFPIDIVGGLFFGGIMLWAWVALLPRVRREAARLSRAAVLALGLGIPLLLAYLLPTGADENEMILGGLAAFLTAPALLPYRPPRSALLRAGAVLLGLVLVFGLLAGSSALLPEEVKRSVLGGFVRYLLLSYSALLLLPWLLSRIAPETTREPMPPLPQRERVR